MAKSAPELADKIRVAYNPLPPELADLKLEKALDEVPTILYVGGDSYIKGFHIVLKTLYFLNKKRVNMKFIMAGSYSQMNIKTLKNIAKKLNALEILILGKINYCKIIELHKSIWALFYPSIVEEPLPYAVVESMALGTLPVVSKTGGILEVLGGTYAIELAFQPRNIEDAVSKLEMLALMSKAEIISLGHKLQEKNKISARLVKNRFDLIVCGLESQ